MGLLAELGIAFPPDRAGEFDSPIILFMLLFGFFRGSSMFFSNLELCCLRPGYYIFLYFVVLNVGTW